MNPLDQFERGEPVTQRLIDVCMGGGVPDQTLTLWPGDSFKVRKNGDLIIAFRVKSQETILIKARHIRWYSIRDHEYVPLKPKAEGIAP